MNFSKNFLSKWANLEIYEPYKKRAISSFVQSGNFETLTLTEFEPAALRVAVGHLTHCTKFPYEIFLRNFFTRFYNLYCGSVASRIEQQSAISIEKA